MLSVNLKTHHFIVKWTCSLVVASFTTAGFCQKRGPANETYLVDPGVHPGKVIPVSKQYQYPEFREGRVFLSTGKQSESLRLNYNLLYDAIQLIDQKGDTAWLDKTIVKYVQIESDYYFSDLKHGYFRMVTKEGPINLMTLSRWIILSKYSLNGQWQTFETQQVPSRVEDFYFPSQYTRFVRIEQYFFKSATDVVHQPSKHSLMKIFPDHRKPIKRYISNRRVDFTKESDLQQLVAFCNKLVATKDQE